MSEQINVNLRQLEEEIEVDLHASTEEVNLELTLPKPNILLVVIDDCGVDFMGGVSEYATWLQTYAGIPISGGPNWAQLDFMQSLADEGVTFTEARAYPVCSPSRACWHSGRYGFRTGCGIVVKPRGAAAAWSEFSTAPASIEYILPKTLSDSGYRTGMFGKWHMGLPDGGEIGDGGIPDDDTYTGNPWERGSGWSHPTDLGWETFRGVFQNLNKQPLPTGPAGLYYPGYYNFYYRDSIAGGTMYNQISQQARTHNTDVIRGRLKNWITDQGGEPWFACWALNAIHQPWGHYNENDSEESGCLPEDPTHTYNSYTCTSGSLPTGDIWSSTRGALEQVDLMLEELKDGIGTDTWDRTVVIIVGDNGTADNILEDAVADGENFGTYDANVISDATERLKQTVYEPGIRVPLIVRGPVVVSGNRTSNELVDIVDLYETIRDIAGVNKNGLDATGYTTDSHSFGPVLRNTSGVTTRTFSFSEYFSPNGDPAAANPRNRAYLRWFTTGETSPALTPDETGLFKILRLFDGTDTTYMFKLQTSAGAAVDPYEQTDIYNDATYLYNRNALNAELDALLAS